MEALTVVPSMEDMEIGFVQSSVPCSMTFDDVAMDEAPVVLDMGMFSVKVSKQVSV